MMLRPGTFVGRWRPDWGKPWERTRISEFGLVVIADGLSTYTVAGKPTRCKRGTRLVRLWQGRTLGFNKPERHRYERLNTGRAFPFLPANRTPLSVAVTHSLGWG